MRKVVLALVLLGTALTTPAFSQAVNYSSRGGALLSIVVGNSSYSPSDAEVVHIGPRPQAAPGAASFRRIKLPEGTWYVVELAGSVNKAGGETSTTETGTIGILKNGTDDMGSLGNFSVPTTSAGQEQFDFTGLNIGPLTGSDYIEVKVTNPTWATNPSSVQMWGVLYLEKR